MPGKPDKKATDLIFCVKCKKQTPSVGATIKFSKNQRKMLASKCGVCGTKKNLFVKDSFEL